MRGLSRAAARTGNLKEKGGRNTEKWKAGGPSGARMKIKQIEAGVMMYIESRRVSRSIRDCSNI